MEKGSRPLEEAGKFIGGLFGDAVESAKIAYKELSELPEKLEEAGKDIAKAVEQGYEEGLFIKTEQQQEAEADQDDKESPSQS